MDEEQFSDNVAVIDEYAASKGVESVPLGSGETQPAAQVPSVGRIAHFVDAQQWHLAAIITGTTVEGGADLHVFPYRTKGGEFAAAHDEGVVAYSDEKTPGTWHWPERE